MPGENERIAAPEETAALLLTFFKTFIDPVRLRLAARLLVRPATMNELALHLHVEPRSVIRHLAQLEQLGLVTVVSEGRERSFRLNEERLRTLAVAVLQAEQTRLPKDERAKTLASFLRDGRLVRIPTQQRKQLYVLAEVSKHFQAGQTYTEPQVNAILKNIYPDDYVTLRRLLVDFGFLKRDSASGGAVYTKGLAAEAVLAGHGIEA